MLWLPLFGLALGELMGFGPFGALGTTPGLLSFLGAIGLTYVGGSITQRMLEKSRDHQVIPGEHWFRLGILLSGGLALSQALEQSKFDQRGSELIDLALSTGASLSTLISAQQQVELADYSASQIASAKELAVKLLIPLGLTTLPAFLILTVFPMLIGIGNK
jgi:tight adherence protein B